MNVSWDTETFLSAPSVSVTSQDRTARPATWREECVLAQIERGSVAARKMWRETTVTAVNQTHLGCRYEIRWAAANVTVMD